MFDSVGLLASNFLKLNASGCVLFRRWNGTFYCDAKRNVHTEIDFGIGDDKKVLRGRKQETHDVVDEVKLVCDFLESCLDGWSHLITVKRGEFYFLNHYTTEQLVILCQELAKFCLHRPYSPGIFPLLYAVKPGCTREQLTDAAAQAFSELRTVADQMPPLEGEDDMETADDTSDDVNDPQRLAAVGKFLEEVEEAGYSRQHAMQAMKALQDDGPLNSDDGNTKL